MGGQAAEQIIAGVVLSDRLAVTMYGAIHRAQFSGQRNLRGLVVDQRMLAEDAFRTALTDRNAIATAVALDHKCIVPTFGVESNGPDVVIVTRGVGRYVTVQDLIAAARANRAQNGKLPTPVAAAIGKSVVEALAAAHKARVVHGAVHPRSVLIDEGGEVQLGDFVVGRALTTAVAQGADSSLWRGLSGFLAPELAVGEAPTPACDVFAVGALLFTMLSGEAPPGTLHVTPAVERLVQRALDTDVNRRYKTARDLLENLLEAFEDDRWELADRGEVIKAAGLSSTDTNIDDATEDLLASLGSSLGAVQVTPVRPSVDLRAEAAAARHTKTPTPTSTAAGGSRLDALLADLDDSPEHTAVEDIDQFKRHDPISDIIKHDPRKREAIVQMKTRARTPVPRVRVPSLDDVDDDDSLTPLPPPERQSDAELRTARPNTLDEAAAFDALAGLDGPVQRVSSAAQQAAAAAEKLEKAASRAEAAAARVETTETVARRDSTPLPVRPVVLDAMPDFDPPPPRLRSRAFGIISALVVIGGAVGFYMIYRHQQGEQATHEARQLQRQQEADEQTRLLQEAQLDPGTILVTTTPPEASVWLKLGRTPLDSVPLSSGQLHRIRVELEGYHPLDTEVVAASWAPLTPDGGAERRASVNVMLKAAARDRKTGKAVVDKLPARPPNLVEQKGFTAGEGPVHVESTPPGAEVWLLIGIDQKGPFPTVAGRPYELRAVADGYLTGYVSITTDEWRDPSDPKTPIDRAKKRRGIEKTLVLEREPVGTTETGRAPKKGT
ncbi:MAG: protein kinase [Deltaproteobacteria bacterium]|nr:protein kinase [Deltaproteobacteria bacterium]